MTPQSVPKRPFGFFVEEIGEENLLYRIGSHKAIHLNETATVIWKLCDGSRNVQEIIDLLKQYFPESGPNIAAEYRRPRRRRRVKGSVGGRRRRGCRRAAIS
jgi:coenzyme PQQ synthesis protein D (PqqD)